MGATDIVLDRSTPYASLKMLRLDSLAWLYLITTYEVPHKQFARKFGENSGTVQFFHGGIFIDYKKREDGLFDYEVFDNGRPDLAKSLVDRLKDEIQLPQQNVPS